MITRQVRSESFDKRDGCFRNRGWRWLREFECRLGLRVALGFNVFVVNRCGFYRKLDSNRQHARVTTPQLRISRMNDCDSELYPRPIECRARFGSRNYELKILRIQEREPYFSGMITRQVRSDSFDKRDGCFRNCGWRI
ncbi:hypothetical protein CEXT_228851 [Caerostris extrusa]|uniref:Uncharacterized protein n=1 Tax=Caerostris extrusa TaxID=172846 RepID=A0AAV4NSY4_CAEEX|nr:hypothetical protein CEXT_228851 [Caerostris extrusa]